MLLDAHGRPRLTDFGLAKKVRGGSELTASGQIMGTPSYMPPEQAAGNHEEVGPLSDVYALGAILYCLLTGRPPFQASSVMDTLMQVHEQEPVPPGQLNAQIARDLETICLKCLEKERSRRYPSAVALAEDLRRFLAGEPVLARPVSPAERGWRWCRRNPVVAGLLAALFVVLAGMAGGASWMAIREKTIANSEKQARTEADSATAIAQQQRAIAETKSAESLERLANQLVSNGNPARAEGDWLACLPWYADALAIDTDHPDRKPLHRMRVAATLRRVPLLVHLSWMTLRSNETVAFAPDGLRLVGGTDGRVITLDPLTGQRDEARLALPQPVGNVRLSPDGRVAVRLLERPGAKPRETVTELLACDVARNRALGPAIEIAGAGIKVAFSPDARNVATWGNSLPLQVWYLVSGREMTLPIVETLKHELLQAERAVVLDIEAAPEISLNQKFRLQQAASLGITGRETAPVSSSQMPIRDVVYSDDGRQLALSAMIVNYRVGLDKSFAQVFDAETGRSRTPPLVHRTYIGPLAFSPDGARLVTLTNEPGDRPKEAQVWDTSSGKVVLGPLNHGDVQTGSIFVVAFSPDSRRLATAGTVDARVWDIASSRSHDNSAPLSGKAGALAFSPDGRWLATLGGQDGVARVWDASTLEPLTPPLRQAGAASSLRFSADGRLLVTVGSSTAPRVLESRAWDLTGPDRGTGRSLAGRWSTPDGRLVLGAESKASYKPGKTTNGVILKVVERSSGTLAAPVVPPQTDLASVWQAALSDDGRRLISAWATPNINPVRTWDFRTNPPVIADLKQTQAVAFVALARDGQAPRS